MAGVAGDPDEAADLLREAVRLAPGRLAMLAARVRLRAGDLSAARRVFDDGFEVADLREGEDGLTELWCALQAHAPLQRRYDFRMTT